MIKFFKHLWFKWKFRKIIGPKGIPGREVKIPWELVGLVVSHNQSIVYISFSREPGSDWIPEFEGELISTSTRTVFM